MINMPVPLLIELLQKAMIGVAIYETDRANNRILQADPGL